MTSEERREQKNLRQRIWRMNNKEKARLCGKAWRKKNPDKLRKAWTNRKNRLKLAVFEQYGNKCACCGEDTFLFLDLDHVNNDGNLQRLNKAGVRKRGNKKSYQGALVNPLRYQILCCNCNCGKSRNRGVCPHVKDALD